MTEAVVGAGAHAEPAPELEPETEPETEAPTTVRADGVLRRRIQFRTFSAPSDAERVRRPTDVVLLALAALGLALLSVRAPGPTAVDTVVSDFLTQTQQAMGWFWQLVYALLGGWTLLVLLVSLISHARKRLFLAELLAVAIAGGVASVATAIVGGGWTDNVENLFQSGSQPVYTAMRIAVAVAVVSTASTHLAAAWRSVGRWLIFGGSLAVIALGYSYVIGVLAGVCAGAMAASAVHLLLGAPLRHLSLGEVEGMLADFGIGVTGLRDRGLDRRGIARLQALDSDGRAVLVKVFGRDAWDAQLLVRVWRSLVWRDDFTFRRTSRHEQVEHEAAATMLAQQNGVAVVPVLALGATSEGDAFLVLRDDGPTLAAVGSAALDASAMAGAWNTLTELDRVGTSHNALSAEHVVVRTDGSLALTDFDDADLGAQVDARHRDQARMIVMTSVLVGPERAVAAALAGLGADRLAAVLPYVQTAALSKPTAEQVTSLDWTMDDLRAEVAAQTGVEVPELEQLRRVSWRSIGKLALIGVVIYGLWSVFSGISLAQVWSELKDASWGWIIAALLLAPIVQVPQAISTIGACFRPLRFMPALMLQYAIQFIALAIPSSAARVALEIRFFQMIGVPAAGAVSISMVDSFSGFLIQVTLMVVIIGGGLSTVSFSSNSTDASSSGTDINWEAIAAALVLLIVAFLFALLWSKFRAFVKRFWLIVRDRVGEGREALGVIRSPFKLLLMFGGNLVAQLVYAFMLGLCLKAFGYSTSYANLILINTFVSLFAGFMPVPGGVGVSEAALTAGLMAAGIPETAAVSTAVSYRMCTFYLPPSWTWYGTRWLKQRDLL